MSDRFCSPCRHTLDKDVVNDDRFLTVVQRRHEVLHARTLRMALDVAKFANRLHAAHLDAFDLVRHKEFLERDFFPGLVVPDFNVDAPVQRPPRFRLVASHGHRYRRPIRRTRLRAAAPARSEIFRNFAGSFARQSGIVAIDLDQSRRQRLIVRVPDQVQAHVQPVLHAFEDGAERFDGRRRYRRNA